MVAHISRWHAGDQIGHLWWRILNGELPKKPPKVFTMLIGTNDLTAADCNMNETELLATVPGIQYRWGVLLGCTHPLSSVLQAVLRAKACKSLHTGTVLCIVCTGPIPK